MTPDKGTPLKVDTPLHRLDGKIVIFHHLSEYWGWWIVEHEGEHYGFYPGELKPVDP